MDDVQYFGDGSVQWRWFITMDDVQYREGCSSLLGMFSTVEDVRVMSEYHLWLLVWDGI